MTTSIVLPPASSGGGGGAVDSVNGFVGVVVLTTTNISEGTRKYFTDVRAQTAAVENAINSGTANKAPSEDAVYNALLLKQDVIAGQFNAFAGYNGAGVITSFGNYVINTAPLGFNGMQFNHPVVPTATGVGYNLHVWGSSFNPTADSDENWNVQNMFVNVGDDDGFQIGDPVTGAGGIGYSTVGFTCTNKSSMGRGYIHAINANFGNGTDPISVYSFTSYSSQFFARSGVTFNSTVIGHGINLGSDAGSLFNQQVLGLTIGGGFSGDVMNGVYGITVGFNFLGTLSSSNVLQVTNAYNNVTGSIVTFSDVQSLSGTLSQNYFGLIIQPNITGSITQDFFGINVNPNIASCVNATGMIISMTGVTASGTKKAMDITGDVAINGALSFTGALSIGKLTANYVAAIVDGGGQPTSLHQLITQVTAAPGATTANIDTIGVNTAMIMNIGAGANITSGPFGLGLAALALPCVVGIGAGAVLDFATGCGSALTFGGGTGTLGEAHIFRAIIVPDGTTTISKSKAYLYDEPFGAPATQSWGLYIKDAMYNWVDKPLKLGGTDTPDATFQLHVAGDSKLEGALAHLTGNVGFYGTSPVAQPASAGAQTAGAAYTATEQTMLQQVYDAVRAIGLMS